jgi:CDP-diacylglycerol--glycerol-3-phosphate 3-phosphatidyltransferase
VTGRVTGQRLPGREEYLRQWSALHGGAPVTGLIGLWIGISYRVALPLARAGAGPNTVTALGLLVALGTVPAAAGGGRWPLLAVLATVLSGLFDNLDGAVAVLTGRTTRGGAVLDALCDRIADAGYCAALWLAGAAGPVAVLGGGLAWLHEYLRARAAVAGMSEIGIVTVSERPTRVIVTAMFLLGCGLYPASASGWALAGAAAWSGLGLIGLVQLVVVVGRRLGSPGTPAP